MGGFFETMSRHEGLTATYIPAMLIDHPVTTDRIAEARARAAQFPPRSDHDSESYSLIRERVRVLSTPADIDLIDKYERKIKGGNADLADRYAYALSLTEHNRAEDAVKVLTPLVQQHEEITLLHIALEFGFQFRHFLLPPLDRDRKIGTGLEQSGRRRGRLSAWSLAQCGVVCRFRRRDAAPTLCTKEQVQRVAG